MKVLKRTLARMRNVVTRQSGDLRLREEMEDHLARETEAGMRAGMYAEAARREARLKFGGVESVREQYHAEEGLPLLENLMFDIRYGLRELRRSPAFAAVAVVTLMLGIGANIVVFGVVNAVLLHPLSVSDPQSLYQFVGRRWMSGGPSYPAFEDYRQRNSTFSGMAAEYGLSDAGLNWQKTVREVYGYDVSGNYFDVLGVQPELGRFFRPADEHGPDSAPYVVLGDALWRSAFGADRGVIGTTVDLNKHPFTVIGVAPPQFHGTERFLWPDYWIPMVNEEQVEGWDFLHSRLYTPIAVIGRLKPGVTPQQATENLNAIAANLAREYPATDKDDSARLIRPGLMGDERVVIRRFLYSVTALALLVLLAACANLASLFAARAADRSRELALRVALGSNRRRLARQLLTEAMLVALIGGAAGVGCAAFLLRAVQAWRPFPSGPEHLPVTVDARIYLAGLVLAIGSALLFRMIPARQAWQSHPLQAMKSGAAERFRLRRFALRDLLLGFQIATCTLLVTASLAAVRSMISALHAPLGIGPQGATLATMDLSQVGQTGGLALTKEKEMIEAAQSIPGVTAAGTVDYAPLSGAGMRGIPIYRPGTVEFRLDNEVTGARVYPISPAYLQAAGTRLLGGRNVLWQDTTKTPYVAVVNETFAHDMWGQKPAIGRHFILWSNLTTVVGVAENGKYGDLTESPQAAVYLPLPQCPQSNLALVVRSHVAETEMAAALQHTLGSIEPNVPITIQSWPAALSGVLLPARVATLALGIMGMLSAMLAVTGIFGMAAYSVSQRMKELAIRVALGAHRAQVMVAAVQRPLILLGVGSAIGLLAGVFASRFLGQIVYQARPGDPLVIGGAILAMMFLGVAASAIPARRALSADPSRLMREE